MEEEALLHVVEADARHVRLRVRHHVAKVGRRVGPVGSGCGGGVKHEAVYWTYVLSPCAVRNVGFVGVGSAVSASMLLA